MARVIVVSDNDKEIEDAVNKALADHEVIFVAPSPANFLHLCLGMLPDDPNDGVTSADIEEPDSEVEDATADKDKKNKEEPASEPEETEEEPVKESFVGECLIHGEKIEVVVTENDITVLETKIQHTIQSDKITYHLNEMEVSGWIDDVGQSLNERFTIAVNNTPVSIIAKLSNSDDGVTRLLVGKDYSTHFQTNVN